MPVAFHAAPDLEAQPHCARCTVIARHDVPPLPGPNPFLNQGTVLSRHDEPPLYFLPYPDDPPPYTYPPPVPPMINGSDSESSEVDRHRLIAIAIVVILVIALLVSALYFGGFNHSKASKV